MSQQTYSAEKVVTSTTVPTVGTNVPLTNQPMKTNVPLTATTLNPNLQQQTVPIHQETGHTVRDAAHNVAADVTSGVKNIGTKLSPGTGIQGTTTSATTSYLTTPPSSQI